jgi:hypothetical protein
MLPNVDPRANRFVVCWKMRFWGAQRFRRRHKVSLFCKALDPEPAESVFQQTGQPLVSALKQPQPLTRVRVPMVTACLKACPDTCRFLKNRTTTWKS